MVKAKKLTSYLSAGFTCYWIKTSEPDRAEAMIKSELQNFVREDGQTYGVGRWTCSNPKKANPMIPLDGLSNGPSMSVALLFNYHWFIAKSNMVIQTILDSQSNWANECKAIIVISPKSDVPVELEKTFLMMELELPGSEEIQASVEFIADSVRKSGKDIASPTDKEMLGIVGAAKGLTKVEMENVFSLCCAEYGNFDVAEIADMKDSTIESGGLLEVVRPNRTFDDVIGLDAMKEFALVSLEDPKARGFLMIGHPGCCKTVFMEALSGETGIKTVKIDWGKLTSKWRGEEDDRVETIIEILKAIGRVIVQIDEFNKQFSSAGADSTLDPTGVRTSGRWLRFMSDEKPDDVFILGTANTFDGIPDEYLRIGRWDSAPFFVGLPDERQRTGILQYYVKKHNLSDEQLDNLPKMDQWSGSDIEGCCLLAQRFGYTLSRAAKHIIPRARSDTRQFNSLEEWQQTNAVQANEIDPNGFYERKSRAIRGI